MIQKLLYSTLVLSLLGCGGGNDDTTSSTSTNSATQNNPLQVTNKQDNNTTQNTISTQDKVSHVSVQTCIQETLQTTQQTLANLETLSCANLTDRNFALLATLPALHSLSIIDTALTGDDVNNLATHIIDTQMKTLILENDNLTKSSADRIDPKWNNSYGAEHFPNLTYLSFKDNPIEGLLVVDYFPALETLDLRGNVYPTNRLHHIGFVDNLKTFYIGGNPNIQNLNDMRDGPSAEASIETMDISDLTALTDISELLRFRSLTNLTIDSTQESQFADILSDLRAKGVRITTLQ